MIRDNENAFDNSIRNKRDAASKLTFKLDEITEMLKKWDELEALYLPEKVINNLFTDGKSGISNNPETEFLKICIVNQVYGTNLYTEDILFITKYLSTNSKELNPMLEAGDPKIITKITCCIKKQRGKFCYSFATKYCSFAAPESAKECFPIYDSYMSVLYKTRRKKWNPDKEKGFYNYYFEAWEDNPLHDANRYEIYRNAVKMMQKEIATEKELSIKELDQYLWIAMKTYSNL